MVAKLVCDTGKGAFMPVEIFVQISMIISARTALGAGNSCGENPFTKSEADPRITQFGFTSGTSVRCFRYLRSSDFSELKQDLVAWHYCLTLHVRYEWTALALSLMVWSSTQPGMSLQLSGATCVQTIGQMDSADTAIRASIMLHGYPPSGPQDLGSDSMFTPQASSKKKALRTRGSLTVRPTLAPLSVH